MNKSKRSNKLAKSLRALHRDIGYFCIGMTVVFAVSGIAVNHIEDWNPNYQVDRSTKKISVNSQQKNSEHLDLLILKQLGITQQIKTTFWESENRYKLFLEKAEQAHLVGLKGHRSVGGMRASLYNSMPMEGVDTLVDFMTEFKRQYA